MIIISNEEPLLMSRLLGIFNRFTRIDIEEEELKYAINESLESYKCFEKKPVEIAEMNKMTDMIEFCTICQSNTEKTDEIIKTECNHMFHETCITEWIKYKAECPICKFKIKVNLKST